MSHENCITGRPVSHLSILQQLQQELSSSSISSGRYSANINNNINTTIDSPMNIEFSTEQLELQLNPANDFIPQCYASQPTKSSQESSISLGSLDGPLSITSPSSSQVISQSDWRFEDPNMQVTPDIYKPEVTAAILGQIILTPQSTPPRSPINDGNQVIVNSKPQAVDMMAINSDYLDLPQDLLDGDYDDDEITDIDQLLSPAASSDSVDCGDVSLQLFPEMESEPQVEELKMQLEGEIDCWGTIMQPEAPLTATASMNAPPASPTPEPVLITEPLVTAVEPSIATSSSIVHPSQEPSKKSPKVTSKSSRGRRKKTGGKDREEIKRSQNARAAKKYREKQQQLQSEIQEKKKLLEEEVAALRRKLQSRMDERNIMLFMVYDLAKEKNSLDKFIFPDWVEPLYKKRKEGI